MSSTKLLHPVMIHGPIVILPVGDYHALLAEAGYLPAPKLARQIATARERFRKGKTISWEQLKRDLK